MPAPLVSDALWLIIEPMLLLVEAAKPKGARNGYFHGLIAEISGNRNLEQ